MQLFPCFADSRKRNSESNKPENKHEKIKILFHFWRILAWGFRTPGIYWYSEEKILLAQPWEGLLENFWSSESREFTGMDTDDGLRIREMDLLNRGFACLSISTYVEDCGNTLSLSGSSIAQLQSSMSFAIWVIVKYQRRRLINDILLKRSENQPVANPGFSSQGSENIFKDKLHLYVISYF